MKIIEKFKLSFESIQEITVPYGSRILTIHAQEEQPRLWVLYDNKETKKEIRFINIHSTGYPFFDQGAYISTFHTRNGAYTFHAFESGPPKQL